jgi:hypothetical protein
MTQYFGGIMHLRGATWAAILKIEATRSEKAAPAIFGLWIFAWK